MLVEFQGESSAGSSYDNVISVGNNQVRHKEKPNILMFVGRIREQVIKKYDDHYQVERSYILFIDNDFPTHERFLLSYFPIGDVMMLFM